MLILFVFLFYAFYLNKILGAKLSILKIVTFYSKDTVALPFLVYLKLNVFQPTPVSQFLNKVLWSKNGNCENCFCSKKLKN